MTRWMQALALVALVACGGGEDEDAVVCGETTCADGEFCLTESDADGNETEVCAAFPGDCTTVDAMCFDDPEPCVEYWADEVCPGAVGSGCFGIGSQIGVNCSYGASSTVY